MPSVFAKVFALYQNAQHGCLDVNRFLQALTDVGLLTDDPRLKSMQRKLKHIQVEAAHTFLRDFRINVCFTSLWNSGQQNSSLKTAMALISRSSLIWFTKLNLWSKKHSHRTLLFQTSSLSAQQLLRLVARNFTHGQSIIRSKFG